MRATRLRSGQAMLETALAVIFITFVFLIVFQVAHMVTVKIMLSHAAARAARAKSVGFNEWMCKKAARVAMIPVAGRRLRPEGGELDERSIVPIYMQTETEPRARYILEYERWQSMDFRVDSGHDLAPEATARVGIRVPRFYLPDGCRGDDGIAIDGEWRMESHYPMYLEDWGR